MARKMIVQREDESTPAMLTEMLAEDEAQLQHKMSWRFLARWLKSGIQPWKEVV
jgi:hypothetical protein